MGGWLLAMPSLRRRSGGLDGRSRRLAAWFAAFGALCIVEGALMCAFYWGTFGLALRVMFQARHVQVFYALAAGTVLWEIRTALRGETNAGRTTLLVRGSLAFLATYYFLKAALTNRDGVAPDSVLFMSVFEEPLLWVTASGIVVGVAWELWQWADRQAPLPSRTKCWLYLAAPILSVQVVTGNWSILEGIHLINRPWAILLLWLNVLLPWLLVGGSAFARQPAESPGIAPSTSAP